MMRAILIPILAVSLLAAACESGADGGDTELTVVASVYPLAEAARRIGGDAVEVVELTPPGVEPHDLELTPDDVEAIATADVVLFAGGGLQPAVEDAVGEASGVVVDATAGLATRSSPGGGDAADPHVWLDPTKYAAMVRTIAGALDDAAPDREGSFADEGRTFEAELGELDLAFRDGLDECDGRLLVVNHAAFGYLAEAYDLHQEAISGVAPGAEPDPARLAELEELVATQGVRTIFLESLVSPDVGQTLASEAGVATAVLNPLEGLTPEQREAGASYLSIMRENLEALRDGLGCR